MAELKEILLGMLILIYGIVFYIVGRTNFLEKFIIQKLNDFFGLYADEIEFEKKQHGKWIYERTYYEADECHCSLCDQRMTTRKGERMKYCPNCGADMQERNDENV